MLSDKANHPKPKEPTALKDDSGVTWNAWSAIVVSLIIFVVAQLIAGAIMLIYPTLQHWPKDQANAWLTNSVIGEFFYVLLAETITVLAVIGFIRWRKGSLGAIGLNRPNRSDPLFALAGLGVYIVFYFAVLAIIIKVLFPHLDINQTQDVGFSGIYHGWQLF